jgi:class 3 adenylate cyclase
MAKGNPKATSRSTQHAYFRKALRNARGRAEQVIVVFVDVRGFSAFSSSRDSVDIGLYLRRLFLSLMDDFFPHASYHKSTGDGMMIVYPYRERTLAKTAQDVIKSSVRLYSDFSELAAQDNMITFQPPNACGIGINRGTVCCIQSDGETLDYSGHVLNLAARLMDLARPAGIVMHASLGNMIPQDLAAVFEISSVYVRGIAENQPVPVYSLKGVTSIPHSAMSPPPTPWGVFSTQWTVAEVKKLPARYWMDAPNIVTKKEDVVVRVYWPGALKSVRRFEDMTAFDIKKIADKTEIVIETKGPKSLVEKLSDDIVVTLEVKYRQ